MVETADPKFEFAYEKWLDKHIKMDSGERKRKLAKGIGYAQKMFLFKIWWPLFRNLNEMIPEFEVRDFKDGYRYLDFAWQLNMANVAIEIDGFGPHWRNVDRWQFADHLRRQNDLILDDWIVLRFSYDEIMEHPRKCQQTIMQAKGKWGHVPHPPSSANDPIDRAILDYAAHADGPFSPAEAAERLGWNRVTIVRRAKDLSAAGKLIPAVPGKQRNRRYILNSSDQ
ncbi:helix-turn-helix domain-containing protein [Cohnella terricola]|uniref:Helix-turn-helix domain-containing protein n=1 Tax=Cohnella terricola TaxID=1289167 RepID=A0A559JEJ3_9BACL|nr:helix-turn-helix domain-containing protein [Cohnella terricola]TVX98286.1 helix-turn-helix domain-containing protein [Cohnella terricola]